MDKLALQTLMEASHSSLLVSNRYHDAPGTVRIAGEHRALVSTGRSYYTHSMNGCKRARLLVEGAEKVESRDSHLGLFLYPASPI